jgi:hypothetical protein
MSANIALLAAAALAGVASLRKSVQGGRNEGVRAYDLPDIPEDRKITRAGFPWPQDTLVYHATTAGLAIQRQGFRTREQGAKSALGGGHNRSVSTTLSFERAASIALGLDTLRRLATRELSIAELVDRLHDETGVNLMDLRMLGIGGFAGLKSEEELRERISLFDRGFVLFGVDWREFPDFKPPAGSVDVQKGPHYIHGMAPAGSGPFPKWTIDYRSVAFEVYRSSIRMGSYRDACFDPLFLGTDMEALAAVPERGIGVFTLRVKIPRVSASPQGAVDLGYFDREYVRWAGRIESMYGDAEGALDGFSSDARMYASNRPLIYDGYRSDYMEPIPDRYAKMDGNVPADPRQWLARQQGVRTKDQTMLYYESEHELRVFDPSKIEIVSFMGMEELRRHFRLGDRLTFPFFDQKWMDVRVWPPGVRRAPMAPLRVRQGAGSKGGRASSPDAAGSAARRAAKGQQLSLPGLRSRSPLAITQADATPKGGHAQGAPSRISKGRGPRGQRAVAPPPSPARPLGYHCSGRPLEPGAFRGSIRSYEGSVHEPEIRDVVFGSGSLRDELSGLGLDHFPEEGEDHEEWSGRLFKALKDLGIEIVFVSEEPLGGERGVRLGTGYSNDFGRYCAEIHLSGDVSVGHFSDHHVSGRATAILYDSRKGRPQIYPVDTRGELEIIEFPW